MAGMRGLGAKAAHMAMFVLALGAAAPAGAQSDPAPRVWTAVSVRGRTSANSPWQWSVDSMVRTRDGVGTMDFAAGLISISRHLSRRSAFGVGYAYGTAFPDAGVLREHRFVQQYTWGTGGALRVSLRGRLEERVLEGRSSVLFRVRQQARATWPLAGNGTLRGVVSGEVFVKANSTTWARRGLDAGRAFAGVGWTMTRRSAIEVGYVHVYSPGGTGRARHSHVISASLLMTR